MCARIGVAREHKLLADGKVNAIRQNEIINY